LTYLLQPATECFLAQVHDPALPQQYQNMAIQRVLARSFQVRTPPYARGDCCCGRAGSSPQSQRQLFAGVARTIDAHSYHILFAYFFPLLEPSIKLLKLCAQLSEVRAAGGAEDASRV
jgi:hypothetical protein